MGENHRLYGKSMSINFPDFPQTMGFVAFAHSVGNLWGNPCIFNMMKYNIAWKSNGKKASLLWEKYEYQFPMAFVAFSRTMEILYLPTPYVT